MRRGAGERLARRLCANVAGRCEQVAVEEMESRRWQSITFGGERHRLRLRLEGERAGEAADALIASISHRELDLAGHVVADILPVSDERTPQAVRLAFEALTVEMP